MKTLHLTLEIELMSSTESSFARFGVTAKVPETDDVMGVHTSADLDKAVTRAVTNAIAEIALRGLT